MVDSGHIRPWQSVAQISRNRLLVYLYLLHNETQFEEERSHMSMDGPSAACWQYVRTWRVAFLRSINQDRPHRLAHVIGGIVQNVASALSMQTE